MRIADILTSTGDDSDGDGSFSMIGTHRAGDRHWKPYYTFRLLIHYFRRSFLKTTKKKEPDRTAEISATGSDGVASSSACSASLPAVSEQNIKEMSFNLGAGFSLFYLAAASKHEFDKMKELRTQMEVILQGIKEELQGKYTVSRSSDSNETPAYSTTFAQEAPNVDIHRLYQNPTSYILPDSEITMMSDESSKCHESRQEEFVGGMDQLATELEAELELLQLHLDEEHSQKYSQQQRAEISVEDMSSEGSFSIRFGEAAGDPHGVEPHELERRLHELLEARQEKRINELEAALEHSKIVLREKEIEATWWKDTARLFSQQHVKDTSSLSR